MNLDPKSILIVLHGSIGDVTRALPLANVIRKGFPKAKLAWAVEPASLSLLQNHPAIDEVIVFERHHWWRGIWPFLRAVRARRFELVLDLQRHLKSGLISFLSGAPVRVGFNSADCKEFNWLFNNRFIAATGNGIAKIEHYMKFAEFLGLPSQPIEWNFKLQPEDERRVNILLEKVGHSYAVLFVGTRWASKQWFPHQIAACARFLREQYNLGVILLGSKNDKTIAKEALEGYSQGVTSLVGQTSLSEAVGIIARARLAVGPDTGLMHIAAALGTPVVSLWGATSPVRTGPYGFEDLVIQGRASCAPCYRRRCPIGRICMQSIGAEEIQNKIIGALTRRPLQSCGIGG
jgi:lipopolysaccharide heptosyltransferase II